MSQPPSLLVAVSRDTETCASRSNNTSRWRIASPAPMKASRMVDGEKARLGSRPRHMCESSIWTTIAKGEQVGGMVSRPLDEELGKAKTECDAGL